MIFRFTLSHAILGSQEITAPDGWKDAVLKLERDKNFHSLIEYFDGSFIFYGSDGIVNGGIDFIRQVETSYGFDADLSITVEISVDGYTYETVFIGLLKLEALQEMEDNKMQVPIIRNDFWAKFINRLETPVNIQSELSLDNEPVNEYDSINLRLPPQKIQKRLIAYEQSEPPEWVRNSVSNTYATNDYVQIGFADLIELDELKQKFSILTSINSELPVNVFEAIEAGVYNLDLNIGVFAVGISIGDIEFIDSTANLSFYYQINDDSPVPLTNTLELHPGIFIPDTGETDTVRLNNYHINTNLTLAVGDIIRVYGFVDDQNFGGGLGQAFFLATNEYSPDFDFGGVDYISIVGENRTFLKITAQTTYPQSNAFGFLLHDVAGQIGDRIINRDDTFYSEYLGSGNTIYRQYNQDGCGWKYSLLKGLQLRRYSLTEKPFFLSFKTWWDGANPILNLGLGYEEIDGVEVIRVEEKEHFFDDDISLLIDNVRQIRRVYDPERMFKTVKIGYKQWQSENISGIDDPQTKHTYASRLQKSGTDITLESEFIAASLAIETTRRTTREKSADYKFDNETFIIAINPTPVDEYTSPNVEDYVPELDENFGSITGLLNAETRYNLRITPARNFMRWIAYLSASLQSYLSSAFKFTAGEGNYDMTSDMVNTSDGCDEYKLPLSEKQDIAVSGDPMHLALLYEITVPMEWEEYRTIRDNRKKAVGISQTDQNHISFFIKELNYEVTKSQATITAWPKELMPIEVVEYTPEMIECVPRTTFPLTVDNDTITVDSTEYTVDATEYTI